MVRKLLGIFVLVLFFVSCGYKLDIQFTSNTVLKKIDENTMTIAVYYYMGNDEFRKRLNELSNIDSIKMRGSVKNKPYALQVVTPVLEDNDKDVKVLAYIGSGTLLKENYIISVKHLFDKTENVSDMKIWVFNAKHITPIEAELIAISEGKEFCDDYAVIKLKEDLGYDGARIISPSRVKRGDKVIFVGSPGGVAFLTRFGYLTTFKYFLKKNNDNNLALAFYDDFYYWCVYPGGPGDSGGSIRDMDGNLISVIYCGVTLYDEEYLFANPTEMLWCFLEKHNLEWIGKRDFPEETEETKIDSNKDIVLQKR